MIRPRSVFRIGVFTLFSLFVLVAVGVYGFLWLHTPGNGGTHRIPGLSAQVKIGMDRWGGANIEAASPKDAAAAQGWLIARERLFQLDLIRRKAAGRLSEVFGPGAVEIDRTHRIYGFEEVATAAVTTMPKEELAMLEAFARGVNAYIENERLPWEIAAIRYQPATWQPRDSLLVMLSMFETLNDAENSAEVTSTALHRTFPRPLADFLLQDFGFLDTPMIPQATAPRPLPAPGASVYRFSESAQLKSKADAETYPGSNAWAVSGKLTRSGKPLLAGDPHLTLTVPNLWYRLQWKVGTNTVTGFAIPGLPGIVIGTNHHLAWSFTNSTSDVLDHIEVPKAGAVLETLETEIAVKGQSPVRVPLQRVRLMSGAHQWTAPIVRESGDTLLALQWTALDPVGIGRYPMWRLNSATTTHEAEAALADWSGPVQNCTVATADGHIAWFLAGRIPVRQGYDGKISGPWSTTRRWIGYVPASSMPHLVDPPSGILVNANQRPVPVEAKWDFVGHSWPSPARAHRIQEVLASNTAWDVAGFSALQNDVKSVTHAYYRDLLLAVPIEDVADAERDRWRAITALVKRWDGAAHKDSAPYAFLRKLRLTLLFETASPFLDKLSPQVRDAAENRLRRDAMVLALLSQRPKNLLSTKYRSYSDLLVQTSLQTAAELTATGQALGEARWGQFNPAKASHPFSRLLPAWIARYLDFPADELSGDSLVPRVCEPAKQTKAASMRVVFDLADPASSRFSQPGGQSGHVLSPHYRDLFSIWVKGETVPLELGPEVASATLLPL